MTIDRFQRDLQLYGPSAEKPERLSVADARRYCRRLARGHYENFTVASLLLPRRLRPHFYHVYAYCRWADDLADETADAREALELLDWWQRQLDACYDGRARHPVFVALGETIAEFGIPRSTLADLLVAFRQDQRVSRYETLDQLLEYCRYSANPVGRLVLYLGRCFDSRRAKLSDAVCTGLQLANFCQDVAVDYSRGRLYLPQELLDRFGYEESMLDAGRCNQAFRQVMGAMVDEARSQLRQGLPLVGMVPRELRLDVSLFIHGGLGILEKIRAKDHDVLTHRPSLSRLDKLRIAARCWVSPVARDGKSSVNRPTAGRRRPG